MVPWWLTLVTFALGAVFGLGLMLGPIWYACRRGCAAEVQCDGQRVRYEAHTPADLAQVMGEKEKSG